MRIKQADLRTNTNYAVQVRAVKNGKTSKWSNRYLFTTASNTNLPVAPTGVTWLVSGDSFVATWNPVTVDSTGAAATIVAYELEFATPSSGTTYATAPANSSGNSFTLSFSDNLALFGLPQPNITLRVRAINNKAIKGAFSSGVNAVNPPPAPPTLPVVNAGVDSLDINWTAPSDLDLIGYRVFTGSVSSFTPSTANRIFSGDATRFTYTTTTYSLQYFKIRAVDKFNQESTDLLTSGTPISPYLVDVTPPATPTALAGTITNNANGIGSKVQVTWTMASPPSDLAGFNIRFRPVSTTNYSYMNGIDSADRAASIALDLAYTNYEFQIQAFDTSDNRSAWSSTTTVTSPANAVPATIASMTSVAGNNNIIYSWTPVADLDIKNYEVTFSTSATFASGNITYLTGTATTLTVGGLSYGTTYYARVRAVDLAGQTSAAFSATNTTTTGAVAVSDGSAPTASPNAPNVLGGLSYLYVTWTAVTNTDPVTYEVHLSTTTGFTPSGATKVTEVMGTSAVIDVLPGTTTPLSYSTTYFIKLIAKDRDGAAAAGTQGSGQISKVASTDVTSIGADLIVPGTGFVNALVVNSGGSIQSSNWSSLTAGWKISTTGIEMNDTGSKIKVDALQAGTIGGVSGAGVIQVAAGTSINMNGGYLKSNTYTGTTAATNPSGAGFYLGNDGLRIDQGTISAAAFAGGSFSTGTITMAGGSITGGGWTLNSGGLTIPAGAITAASISLQGGGNIIPAKYASFEQNYTSYTSDPVGYAFKDIIVTSAARHGNQVLRSNWVAGGGGAVNEIFFAESTTDYSMHLEPNTTYIMSLYIYINTITGASIQPQIWLKDSTGTATQLTPNGGSWTTFTTAGTTWTRISGYITTGATVTGGIMSVRTDASVTGASIYMDMVQVEQKNTASTLPSAWTAPGSTYISGDLIRTGSIISSATTVVNGTTIPVWSIPLTGAASFANLQVRGNSVMGLTADGAASTMSSANFIHGTQGWQIRSDGTAEFRNVDSGSFNGGAIAAGTITGTQIAANSVTTDKLVIGDTTNLIRDSNMDGTGTWFAAAGSSQWTYPAGVAAPVAGDNNTKVLRFISSGTYSEMAERLIPVTPGDTYIFSYWVRHQGGADTAGTIYNRIRWYNSSSTTTGVTDQALVYANFSGATWYQIVNQATVPAGVYYAQPQIIPYLVTNGAYYEFDVATFIRMVPAVQTSSSGLRIELATSANAFQSGQQWANISFYNGNAGWEPGLLWANYIAGSPNQGFLSLVSPFPTGGSGNAPRITLSAYSDGTRSMYMNAQTMTIAANTMNLDAAGTTSFDYNLVGATAIYSFRDGSANRVNLDFAQNFGWTTMEIRTSSARRNFRISSSDFTLDVNSSSNIGVHNAVNTSRPIMRNLAQNAGIHFNLADSIRISNLAGDGFMPIQASAFNVNSDITKKSNATKIAGALESIKSLDAFEYELPTENGGQHQKASWHVDKRRKKHPIHRGLMAQHIQKVLPDLVHESDSEGDSGGLTIDIYGLQATMWAGMQELLAEVEDLREQVSRLTEGS